MPFDKLDIPPILQYIYYPRQDHSPPPPGCEVHSLVAGDDGSVRIGCRFYPGQPEWPLLVYFHGNGEVAADYDDIASLYRARGINLFVADFRGYGSSTGQPTVRSQLEDAAGVFAQAKAIMKAEGFSGPLYVMGRSMGSLSALEIAARREGGPAGLILESGFCCISRLIRLFGLPADEGAMAADENRAMENIRRLQLPVLIIHGEYDSLVPFAEGQLMYDHIPSGEKRLVMIPHASHNDIMFMDMRRYFGAIDDFIHEAH